MIIILPNISFFSHLLRNQYINIITFEGKTPKIMNEILGLHIPYYGNPKNESNFQFVYRYLVAKHLVDGNFPHPANEISMLDAKTLMWTDMGRPARMNGRYNTVLGSLVGFWKNTYLVHSMIAISPGVWVGANNQDVFGIELGGRQKIPLMNIIYNPPNNKMGWLDDSNKWKTPMGTMLDVTFKLPSIKYF